MDERLSETRYPRERIATLDILRGIAILGILFMNIPYMGQTDAIYEDARVIGWSTADQHVWTTLEVFLAGTQRGLLELLFGATALILLAPASKPSGPVAAVDAYYRRTVWLIAFGLIHGTLLLWSGDILFTYGIAGLLLFPLRKLPAGRLAAIGSACLLLTAAFSVPSVVESARIREAAENAMHRQLAGQVLEEAETKALDAWRGATERSMSAAERKAEEEGRLGVYTDNLRTTLPFTQKFNASVILYEDVAEAVFTMMIGMALFKWGVLQGQRSRRFYAGLTFAGYGIGIPLNLAEAHSRIASGFLPPDWTQLTDNIGRISTTLGHVGLVVLLGGTAMGALLLRPLKAPGRMALSIYISQTIVTMFILFPGFGFGLWGRFGWSELTAIAAAIVAAQVVLANIWLRFFAMGPLEWLWRWLTYGRRPQLRIRRALPALA